MKRLLPLLWVMCLLCSACQPTRPPSQAAKPQIVCTLFAQYDFARQIAGDFCEVSLLLPPGVESHRYEPTPHDILQIQNCDLFIRIDEHMELWSDTLLHSLDTLPPILDLAARCAIEIDAAHEHEHEHEHEEHECEESLHDPHIWTNPLFAAEMAKQIGLSLRELDQAHAETYRTNAAELAEDLLALDADFQSLVQGAVRKTVVFGSSFALRNFTERYGLSYLAAFDSCGDHAEPSVLAVAEIVTQLRGQEIPVIFRQELGGERVAQSIARETGAQVLLFHSCHNVTREELRAGASYLSLMRQNLENLRVALNQSQ